MTKKELEHLFLGYGYTPYFVEGDDPELMHQKMAETLEEIVLEIKAIQEEARSSEKPLRPLWPILILRSPKGWTGPKEVDGLKTEDFWRSHQVPFAKMDRDHIRLLEQLLQSF